MIDFGTDHGQATLRRLQTEQVIWLITARADGRPWPNPVWFLWDADSFLVYSQPNTAKLRHLEREPRVALHLNGVGWDLDIGIFEGTARIVQSEPRADLNPAYIEKYAAGIERIGLTQAEYGASYSVQIRIDPVSLRGH